MFLILNEMNSILFFYIINSGKVILPNISLPSQNVYFRQGTNVEFGGSNGATEPPTVPPMEGYTLETLSPKTTDFSNPMYDAVQSGTLTEPSLENSKTGNIYDVFSFFFV